MQNRYGSLASWVYHVDKPVGRSFGDIEFYLSRLEANQGPILEPAVGNGRFFIPLLEAGHIAHGFDASQSMLDICKKELSSRGLADHVSQQDFAGFHYRNTFSAAVMPAGSIQLITSSAECLAFLKRIKRCLSPDGQLLVDLDSLACMHDPGPSVRMWELGDSTLTLTESRINTDYLSQTTTSVLKYEHWNSGQLVSSEMELFKLRLWGVDEFAALLHQAGFENVSITLDYETPYIPPHEEGSANAITFEASA
ncbi:class I SAM-dependent methyltransferase [Halomonas sp. THAF12]|uniref:class I SAM-dependent methyltransferase n=1 Tax=Halomonas sp. B23F22_10 TaxID=3459515 RepID=UPI00373E2771